MAIYWKDFLKRRKFLKSKNALDLVPVALVKSETTSDGFVKLLVPRFRNKFLQKFFVGNRLSPEFKVSLDETGSFVWLAINGQKTAGTISDELKKNHESRGLRIDTIDERVAAFLSKLYHEDYISFRGIESM